MAELGIPEGVREVVGRRLSRLSERTNRVLAVASVIGPAFDVVVLRAVTGTDEDGVLSALEEAVAARLVSEAAGGLTYHFAHALVRATLYDELSAARRAALHRQAGQGCRLRHPGGRPGHLWRSPPASTTPPERPPWPPS